jgi:hypothetical protein
MTIDNNESIIQKLIDLNIEIGKNEQEGATAKDYFEERLANELIFRRASGKVIGKEDFLRGLKEASPQKQTVPNNVFATFASSRDRAKILSLNSGITTSLRVYNPIKSDQ